jgi:hypothetical protein
LTQSQKAQTTHLSDVEPAPVPPDEKSTAARRRRTGNRSGGLHQRMAAVIGLGLSEHELPSVDLKTAESQVAILEAVVRALALGKTSGLVASGIVSAVKAAAEITRHDQLELLQEQARLIESLQSGRVVDVHR